MKNPRILFVVLVAAGYAGYLCLQYASIRYIEPTTLLKQDEKWCNKSSTVSDATTFKALEDELERLTSELAMAKTKAETEKRLSKELETKVQDLERAKLSGSITSNSKSFNALCQRIPSSPKAWIDNINVTLGASQDRQQDPSYILRDLNARALEFITPRLSRAMEGFPHHNLDKLLSKTRARFEYLTNYNATAENATIPPPPIRIYVSGGSVAHGQNCVTSVRSITADRCSWPWRLRVLVNNLVGGDMIEIVNGARGGANSQAGRALLAYAPPPQQPIDIIINAHSVNDQITFTRDQAAARNLSLSAYTLDMTQNFTRQVMTHHPDAVLLWLEDYLGNEARNLLELQEYAQTIHTLSKYYGFGVLSYTDAVRDVVYGDTHETALTPVWYQDSPDSNDTMVREVHPGVMMHASVTYLWLHYGWNLLREACAGGFTNASSSIRYNTTRAEQATLHGVQWPRPLPKGLPPRLTTSLRLEDISDLWRNSTEEIMSDSPCPFQWTAGIQKYLDLESLEEDSKQQFAPYLRSAGTWQFTQSDFGQGRFGWAHYEYFANTTTPPQPLTFEVPSAGIRTMAVFVAQNIDPSWKDSKARVTVKDNLRKIVHTQTIDGYRFSSKTRKRAIRAAMAKSVVLTEVDLSGIVGSSSQPSKNFTVEFQHVSGNGFKFMAMALCRFPSIAAGFPLWIGN